MQIWITLKEIEQVFKIVVESIEEACSVYRVMWHRLRGYETMELMVFKNEEWGIWQNKEGQSISDIAWEIQYR